MLSIAKITSIDYYTSLAQEDYYHEGQESPGRWAGALALEFQLAGPAGGLVYAHLMAGQHPVTGEALVQGAGEKHRHGWDLTFSAPKSVSVVWSQADQDLRQKIEQAQAQAVGEARRYVEGQLVSRRGKGGVVVEQPAQTLWADFDHSTSRAQDPQLHTHALLLNICQRQDGSWGTIEPREAYRAKMAAGAIYRAELASQLQKLGLFIERDGDAFRIVGDNALHGLEAEFSTRRAEIKEALNAKGLNGAKAAEIAALDSRQVKQTIPREELFSEWQARGTEYGYRQEDLLGVETEPIEKVSDEQLLDDLTRHASTFHKRDIVRAIAVSSQGVTGAQGIRQRVADLLQSPELVRLQAASGEIRFSTREMIELEAGMAAASEARKNEDCHKIEASAVSIALGRRTLSDQQKAAFEHIVNGKDGVTAIQGMAGAGKSFLLGAANDAWQQSGYRCIGAALSGKAAAGLEEGSGIKSQTIHSLLADIEQSQLKLDNKTVLVIDEAGMTGSRQMSKLVSLTAQNGSKLVLVGDTRQLQPVDAGGAFRAIQGRIGAVDLDEIRRQKNEWQTTAVHDLAAGRTAEALARYAEAGKLHVADDRKAAAATMVKAWYQAANQDQGRPGEYLMLAGTRADTKRLNDLARVQMQADGRLGASAMIAREGAASLQVAEGERILFTRNSKLLGVKNGHLGTVQRILGSPTGEGVRLTVKMDDGRQVTFDSEKYSHLTHGYAVTTHKAQGVTVDHAFVLAGGSMTSRELTYVQGSRQRKDLNWYFGKDEIANETGLQLDGNSNDQPEIAKQLREIQQSIDRMAKERQADTTLDYQQQPDEVELERELSL